MVGGDYTAHSTPGETRQSPQSNHARTRTYTHIRAHIYTRNAYFGLYVHTDTFSRDNSRARARVLNYAHVVRQWLDVYYIHARSSVSRGPDVPLFSLLFSSRLFPSQSFPPSFFPPSLSLFLSFILLPRSFCLQCFLLRSSPSNVHLSRVSDEELIAPESLALLLANERTDGRARRGAILFVRSNVASRIGTARRECICGCVRFCCMCYGREICTLAPLFRTLRPEPQVAARRRKVFGSTESARFVRGSRMSGRREQADHKIIVQTGNFSFSLSLSSSTLSIYFPRDLSHKDRDNRSLMPLFRLPRRDSCTLLTCVLTRNCKRRHSDVWRYLKTQHSRYAMHVYFYFE